MDAHRKPTGREKLTNHWYIITATSSNTHSECLANHLILSEVKGGHSSHLCTLVQIEKEQIQFLLHRLETGINPTVNFQYTPYVKVTQKSCFPRLNALNAVPAT